LISRKVTLMSRVLRASALWNSASARRTNGPRACNACNKSVHTAERVRIATHQWPSACCQCPLRLAARGYLSTNAEGEGLSSCSLLLSPAPSLSVNHRDPRITVYNAHFRRSHRIPRHRIASGMPDEVCDRLYVVSAPEKETSPWTKTT
jgi:hypothetical protein